jgi:tetratricopeptide (TPR) repeat protein
MRWIASLALFLVLTGAARAVGPDDQYLNLYNEVVEADSLQQNGQTRAAAGKYIEAQTQLQKFKDANPNWNPDVVAFRLQYLSDKLEALGKMLQPASAPVAAAASRPGNALEQQIAGLQEQVRALIADKAELQSKLKEALSIQPAAVSPAELAKREEEIVALKKERDLLRVSLDQAKAAAGPAAVAETGTSKLAADLNAAQHKAREADEKLESANSELAALKAAVPNQTSSADLARITQERDNLKEELAARTKDLADAEAHGDKDLIAAQAQLKEALAQRAELQVRLDTVMAATNGADSGEIDQLRARLAVMEAKAVPYTPQELAMLDQPQSQTALPAAPAETTGATPAASPTAAPTATSAAVVKKPHVAHSAMDLPPGAGALMADAMRASLERNFAEAEEKYKQILHQDENNVYVLAHLADAQFAEGHLDDCGTTVGRAIALDPDDPASLYLLGILRYRQEKLDEALNALSRSAQLNSTNPGTQNYLGCVLADKGMRPAAEIAFRKALQLEPEYADAHYNLALIYASAKPPSPELARWHYKRALNLGHPKSPKLEELLSGQK